MSNFAARLGVLTQPLKRCVQTKMEVMFSRKYLLLTNTGIAVVLGTSGDLIQQRYEILQKRQTQWDPKRTRKIMVYDLSIGPACHCWYLVLDALFPGRRAAVVMKKILMDMMIFSPFNVSLFLVVMGIQEGQDHKTIAKKFKDKGTDLLRAEWTVWPPAQVINFFFLPTKYRVLYDNTVSLGFDCYYSYVMYRKDKGGQTENSSEIDIENDFDEKEDIVFSEEKG